MQWFRSLGFRVFLAFSGLFFAFFAITIYVFLSSYSTQLEKNVIHHATQVSDLIKRSTRYSMLKNHREDLGNIIDNIGREEGIEGVWIFNKEGEIQFASRPADLHRILDKKAEQCVFCHRTEGAKGTIPVENRYRYLTAEDGTRMLGMINPIENESSCANAECHAHPPEEELLGLMDIQMSLREVDQSVADTRWKILVISGFLVLLTPLVFWALVRRVLHKPISKLIEGTRQVANMNLDHKIDVASKDEIGDLALAFNTMTENLKNAQQQMILREKLASLGKMSAMVAHQLNNPMSGMLTYAKLSRRNLERNPSSETIRDTLENLNVMGEEARRCGVIVNNLLNFSRTAMGKKGRWDLNAIVRRTADLLRHNFEVKNAKLDLDLADKELLLECDQGALQQLLVEIMVNAMESLDAAGGRVTIRTREVAASGTIRIEIEDTGKGIPEDLLSSIFEPFVTTKEAERGTGLGLAVVYGVVQDHDGTISVDSRMDAGTLFTIDLPDRKAE